MEEREENTEMIVYPLPNGRGQVALTARDGAVWASQKQIAELFSTSKQNVSDHIANIFKEKELDENSVVKDFLTTAADGKKYVVRFYALPVILAVGFRVRGIGGTLFRQWATRNLAEYLVKGFVIDDERLKNPDGRPDYFDELLARIRDIRASEKRFYQKLRDLFALAVDYDSTDKATQMFFAETQNKLLYAVTGKTAAEIVASRADAEKPNMNLKTWNGSIVRKGDVIVAKNYLDDEEIDELNRLVVVFLESAELRAKRRQNLTTEFWRETVDRLLEFNDRDILRGHGRISAKAAEAFAREEYAKFDAKRKAAEALAADRDDLATLDLLETEVKKRPKGVEKPKKRRDERP